MAIKIVTLPMEKPNQYLAEDGDLIKDLESQPKTLEQRLAKIQTYALLRHRKTSENLSKESSRFSKILLVVGALQLVIAIQQLYLSAMQADNKILGLTIVIITAIVVVVFLKLARKEIDKTHTPIQLTVRQAAAGDVYKDIMRISQDVRKDESGNVIKEGTLCVISIQNQGGNIYAFARGNQEHGYENTIRLDDSQREKLKIKAGQEYGFIMRQCHWYHWLGWVWCATDPVYRIGSKITIGLAAVSVIVSALFWFLGK